VKRSVSGSLYPWLLALALPFSSAAQQNTAGSSLTSLEMPFQLDNGYLIVVEGRVGARD
jgi:hypothetical protein